jgi:hypothetical protein
LPDKGGDSSDESGAGSPLEAAQHLAADTAFFLSDSGRSRRKRCLAGDGSLGGSLRGVGLFLLSGTDPRRWRGDDSWRGRQALGWRLGLKSLPIGDLHSLWRAPTTRGPQIDTREHNKEKERRDGHARRAEGKGRLSPGDAPSRSLPSRCLHLLRPQGKGARRRYRRQAAQPFHHSA